MLDAASGEPTWKGSPAPEGVGGMSSAAGTGTFVECPKCKPGSGKPIGHLGRHLGVLVPVCPPAPVEVLASAETVAGRRERKQVQRWSDDPLSTAQLGGEQGKLDELKRNGVAGSGAAGRASARDPAPAKGSSRGPKKSRGQSAVTGAAARRCCTTRRPTAPGSRPPCCARTATAP